MKTRPQKIPAAERAQPGGEAKLSVLTAALITARPWDWIKNVFFFAAPFFSKKLLAPGQFLEAAIAFGIFNLASSGVYFINDLCDRKADCKHPRKRRRPIAAGKLSPTPAATIALALLLAAALGAFLLKPALGRVICGYILLNCAYSKWLKHVVLLDVFAIAAGFVLRVYAGAAWVEVVMSHWLLLCTLLLALFLGFSKRRHELIALSDDAASHRQVLAEYDRLFLDVLIGIVTSVTIVTYMLYTVSPDTVQRFGTNNLVLTTPFVLYGIFRYLYLIYHKNHGGDPTHSLLNDAPLLANLMLWIAASGLIIYK